MGFKVGDDDGGGMSEINVTPLIDIMLVMLIIFMIAFFIVIAITIDIIAISILCPYSKFIIATFDHISIMTAT